MALMLCTVCFTDQRRVVCRPWDYCSPNDLPLHFVRISTRVYIHCTTSNSGIPIFSRYDGVIWEAMFGEESLCLVVCKCQESIVMAHHCRILHALLRKRSIVGTEALQISSNVARLRKCLMKSPLSVLARDICSYVECNFIWTTQCRYFAFV